MNKISRKFGKDWLDYQSKKWNKKIYRRTYQYKHSINIRINYKPIKNKCNISFIDSDYYSSYYLSDNKLYSLNLIGEYVYKHKYFNGSNIIRINRYGNFILNRFGIHLAIKNKK